MSRIVKVKNNTGADATWVGQTITAGQYHDIPLADIVGWTSNDSVFMSVGNGGLIVNKGADITDDIPNATDAWNWMLGDTMPMSDLGNKLAIHSSTKPAQANKEFYLVWTGAGDDLTTTPHTIADGPLLQFDLTNGTPNVSVDVYFSPDFGDVYIHEGYAKWENGGTGDHIDANIIASPSQFQTMANLDLEIVDNWVTYAAGGPGTGTHGFAATPILLKRTKSMDGDWNYDDINGLTPNMAGDGLYKISDTERAVHRYINKIPTRGSSFGYTTLTSDESAWLPPGYFVRITAHNVSDTTWNADVFMEVFREQTAVP